MYEKKQIDLDDARKAIDAVLEKATAEAGRAITVVVVDAEGEAIALARMDGSGYLPRDMAMRKAYTAARMGADSAAFAERMRGIGFEFGNLGDPKLVFAGGGVCIRVDRQVVGAIGVSGRTGEEDIDLAQTGVAAMGLSAP
ncbi:MAG: heme-binding protein [Acidobacteria bacterium]|nr:heme-binding protein [Acidobacteriota bacterium]